MVFATKLDGNTERVMLLPQSVPSDFDGANTRILPRNLAALLTAKNPFKYFNLLARKGTNKYEGRIFAGPTENIVEVAIGSTARKVTGPLQLAAKKFNFEVIVKTKSISFRLDVSRGFDTVLEFAQAIAEAGFETTVPQDSVEKYKEVTGLANDADTSTFRWGLWQDPLARDLFILPEGNVSARTLPISLKKIAWQLLCQRSFPEASCRCISTTPNIRGR